MRFLIRTLKIPVLPREAVFWITGLMLLPFANTLDGFSICPFHNLGLTFCPGCGLGKSILYLFQLDFYNSFISHPLGIPALLIILHRIYTLFKFSHTLSERNSNG
jgi:hypothetical protein